MKYVLDSSVAVKFVLPEPDSGKAIRLLDEYSKALHELIAPDIFSTEVANALVSAERSARIKKGECASLFYNVMSNAPVFYPANPLSFERWKSRLTHAKPSTTASISPSPNPTNANS